MAAPLLAAIDSILEHRFRSSLSALGILVGTLAVMLLISIAQGVKADVGEQVNQLGANLIIVLPGRVDASNPFGGSGNIGLSPFKLRDVDAVREIPGITGIAKWTFVAGSASKEGASPVRAFILGTDPSWFDMRKHEFAEGKALASGARNETVIGENVSKELFGEASALGKEIFVNGKPYTIVGVTREKESGSLFGGGLFTAIIYLPFDTIAADTGLTQIDRIFVAVNPSVEPRELVSRIKKALKESQGGQETFSVLTQEDLLNAIYKVLNVLTYLVVGISTIALFVGGVGIMTVMLMNVNERQREIGIRKTVGAKRRDIFGQFLTEAVLLTFSGGVLALIATLVAIAVIQASTPIRPILTPGIVLLGFGVSVGVGCLFGLIPAMRAAAKDPIESMRQE